MSSTLSLRERHALETRTAILAAARTAFANDDFRRTSLDEIAAAAQVSKGAVYHHFANKRSLFRAVYEELAREESLSLRARLSHASTAMERINVGIDAFLSSAGDPTVRAIMLQQGAAVLQGECREIDEEYYLGDLRSILSDIQDTGALNDTPIDTLAPLLLAMLIEAGALLGRSTNPERTVVDLRRTLLRLLSGLAAPAT